MIWWCGQEFQGIESSKIIQCRNTYGLKMAHTLYRELAPSVSFRNNVQEKEFVIKLEHIERLNFSFQQWNRRLSCLHNILYRLSTSRFKGIHFVGYKICFRSCNAVTYWRGLLGDQNAHSVHSLWVLLWLTESAPSPSQALV